MNTTAEQRTSLVIAIDGTAASGKGTLCNRLGNDLDMAVLDTGKLYRLVGLKTLRNGINPEDEKAVTALAGSLKTDLKLEDLTDPDLKSDQAGQMASVTGQHPGVRQALLEFQRFFATNPPVLTSGAEPKGAILDGRDIGTVIMPNADLKLYITAETEIRAKRRYKELHSIDNSITYEAVFEDMKARDARDAARSAAPMKPADDAIVIDTSEMAIDDVYKNALRIIKDRLGLNPAS